MGKLCIDHEIKRGARTGPTTFLFVDFEQSKLNGTADNGGRGPNVLLRFHANHEWMLVGDNEHHCFGAGDFTLTFPPNSPNLTELIIDPDPGGGELANIKII